MLDTQLFHHHIQSSAETGQGGETAQALPGQVDFQGQHGLAAVPWRLLMEQGLHIRQFSQAFQQASQLWIRARLVVPVQASQQKARHFLPVDQKRPIALGVKHQFHHIGGLREGAAFLHHQPHHLLLGLIGHQHIPVGIQHHGREGVVIDQHDLQGLAHRSHGDAVQIGVAEGRGIAGGQQQPVGVPAAQLQLQGQPLEHRGAGLAAAGFDKAQVTAGDVRTQGQIQLAQALCLA